MYNFSLSFIICLFVYFEVFEYDVILLFKVDEEGGFFIYLLNYKLKWSLIEDDNDNIIIYYYYIMDVLGDKLYFEVKCNMNFMVFDL